ncbi:MAG TPA: DNA-binding response regulator [Firmicutes bacterium]|nr:DNA-binding response regulator [Bacillota bacterium]
MNYEYNKILIVDDEVAILDLLETVLSYEGFKHIYRAQTGAEAIKLTKTYEPDLVLLDVMLPDISGHDVIKEIHANRQIPILFISAKTEEVDRLIGFALGADDYITKPFSAKEVAFRVKARLKGAAVLNEKPSKIFNLGEIAIHEQDGVVYKSGQPLELTAKEYKLLLHLVQHQNKIVSKESISRVVWGEDFFEFDNTISVHISRLRKKIEPNPAKPTYITTVIGLGYKFINKEG